MPAFCLLLNFPVKATFRAERKEVRNAHQDLCTRGEEPGGPGFITEPQEASDSGNMDGAGRDPSTRAAAAFILRNWMKHLSEVGYWESSTHDLWASPKSTKETVGEEH